ncbi:glutathione S-transferase family protein [Acidocella aromatica]|uniref:Glutathione S-transferase n=1 Tax=Acidocella aromatica TaxID=1303579 RepID=A0A840VC95_9PROT|nr:glutathione S-transferase family protein [Acidocella aromatica]MBB5373518.1 glutathione S-transferase [Acidocella aromatica]
MALIFYTNPMSRGRMVRWMLEEIGQPYETKVIPYGQEMKAPAYLAINPMGKIPALVHDHTIITETAAIIAYLADAFPEADLAPTPGTRERGPYYRWLFFGAGPFEAAVMDRALGVQIPPERKGSVGYGSLEEVLATLETALHPGPYLLGDTFSAADIYLGSQIGYCLRFGTIEPRPAFVSYVQHLLARPAAQRAAAMDDALMPPKA